MTNLSLVRVDLPRSALALLTMTAFKSLPDTFDAWVNELLLTWGVPGVAVGIVQQRPAARGTAETASSDCQRQQSPVSVEFKNYGTAGKGRAVTEKVGSELFELGRVSFR